MVTRDQLESMPKIELHVHLEGSIRAETAIALARRHGQDPAAALLLEDGRYARRFRDFQHFVDTYVATTRQMREPEDLRTVASDFAREQERQQVRYSEATFTATTLLDNGMPEDELWDALREGFAAVPGTQVRLIIDVPRDQGIAQAARAVAAVQQAGDGLVAGLGLSGIEGSVPEADFGLLREAADELEIGLAVHAGETGTPDNVRAALDDLGADRIGHGIAVVHDPQLLARVVTEGVPLEICPSSNVTLGLVDDIAVHPFPQLWEAGAAVTVNSDDPPFFSTTLTDELEHATRLAGLTVSNLVELQRRAARAAFIPPARTQQLLDELDAWERLAP